VTSAPPMLAPGPGSRWRTSPGVPAAIGDPGPVVVGDGVRDIAIAGHRPPGHPAPGRPALQPVAHGATPGEVVRNRPWQLVGVMFAAGFVGVTVLRLKLLRTGLKVYAAMNKR